MMKRMAMALLAVLALAAGGGAARADFLSDIIEKTKAEKTFPAQLAGTWKHESSMNQTLTVSDKEFTLNVYNREGKLFQVFSGPMRNVENSKRFFAPAIASLTQDGQDMGHLLKKGGPYHKIFYYKDLTADSVMLYIVNGYADEKVLHRNDEESKQDRMYVKFTRAK